MIFGLDYDDTFPADPVLWYLWARNAAERGHRIVGVTARNRDQIINDSTYVRACERVVYCAGHAKDATVEDLLGFKIDVWIDSKPQLVHQSLAEWSGKQFLIPDAHELTFVPLVVTRDERLARLRR